MYCFKVTSCLIGKTQDLVNNHVNFKSFGKSFSKCLLLEFFKLLLLDVSNLINIISNILDFEAIQSECGKMRTRVTPNTDTF